MNEKGDDEDLESEWMMMQRIKQTPFDRQGMQISAHQSSESPQGGDNGESLLVTFENLAEGPTAQFLDDLEATLQDLLILLQHAAFRYLFKLSL